MPGILDGPDTGLEPDLPSHTYRYHVLDTWLSKVDRHKVGEPGPGGDRRHPPTEIGFDICGGADADRHARTRVADRRERRRNHIGRQRLLTRCIPRSHMPHAPTVSSSTQGACFEGLGRMRHAQSDADWPQAPGPQCGPGMDNLTSGL